MTDYQTNNQSGRYMTVCAPCGTLRGEYTKSDIYRFLGIPYAEPPIEEKRFRRPVRKSKWDGVRDALRYGDRPPQQSSPYTQTPPYLKDSEDCLTLNLWTPGVDGGKRPVIIWIYGGGFQTGSSADALRDGELLAKNGDMVVVTFNYRLGPLGFYDFSSLPKAEDRFDTNCGLWDQIAVIEWVKENIAAFGGNPDNLSVIGESAGASSILALLSVEKLKGVFKRAVLESPASDVFLTREEAAVHAKKLLEVLSIPEECAVETLLTISAETLVEADMKLQANSNETVPFKISCTPVTGTELLPIPPMEAILSGSADSVSVLIGTCQNEMTMFVRKDGESTFPDCEAQFEAFFASLPEKNRRDFYQLYPGFPSFDSIQEADADLVYHLDAHLLAEKLSLTAPAYVYRIDYIPSFLAGTDLGAMHTLECLFVGGQASAALGPIEDFQTQHFGEKIHKSFSSFLSGNAPQGTDQPWPEYGESGKILVFDETDRIEDEPLAERMKWRLSGRWSR